MNHLLKKTLICLFGAGLMTTQASAQVSSNPNKFLGNITTYGNVDAGGGIPAYYKLWNQITCENESKWSSVEGTKGSFNWGCDRAFNYAKQHDFIINETLDEECQEEIIDYLRDCEELSIDQMFVDFEEEYTIEELRLMNIKFQSDYGC